MELRFETLSYSFWEKSGHDAKFRERKREKKLDKAG